MHMAGAPFSASPMPYSASRVPTAGVAASARRICRARRVARHVA